ncbi:hypothetical protein DL93DRAFT_2084695 [Clavulina sp. PMI_390]|nr:hypothetical protein DL93DRAFT_2084695 [Clavulina sp. PMI_390]
MASIAKLPPELLSSIFVSVCQGPFDFETATPSWKGNLRRLKAVSTLASVNSLWRELALSLSQLWAVALVTVDQRWGEEHRTMMQQLLGRSRTLSLTLTVKLGVSPSTAQVRDMWAMIVPQLPRCEHLWFTNLVPRFAQIIFPLPGRLPALKRLGIYGQQSSGGDLRIIKGLFNESQHTAAPLFTHLELIGLPCISGSFEELSSLKMKLVRLLPPYQPLPVLVEAYLRKNIRLETLVVQAPSLFGERDGQNLPRAISLPNLRRLAIGVDAWNWPEVIQAPMVKHLVMTSLPHIGLVTQERFPAIEHLSICNLLSRDKSMPRATLPLFQSVRRLDIFKCHDTSPILQYLIGPPTGPIQFLSLSEVTICQSGRLDRSARDLTPMISKLLLARPNLMISCDDSSLVGSLGCWQWSDLPPNYVGRVHRRAESNLPPWVGEGILR